MVYKRTEYHVPLSIVPQNCTTLVRAASSIMCDSFKRMGEEFINQLLSQAQLALRDLLLEPCFNAHLRRITIHKPPPLRLPPAPQKKALLIGLRYPGRKWPGSTESMELSGSHNDIERWRHILIICGYLDEDIRILSDRVGVSPDSADYPSHENILREMRALTTDSQDDQRRFFVFCGHRKGRLDDGSDSAILGADIENPIRDADIEASLLHPLTRLCFLTTVWDCCRVGNMFSIDWRIDESGLLRPALRRRKDSQPILGRVLVIGACLRNQKAREVTATSGESYGALSYFLTERLYEHQGGFALRPFLRDTNSIPDLQSLEQEILATCTEIVHEPWFYP
ncbi:hypothetical protein FRB95_002229 [Tulasnella sp. JGI-2019a]|nr:hypothetical protein FRB95_002229 [Tulasnella sp. JGI-2019a]